MKHARPDYDRIQDPAGKIPADEPVFLLRAQDKSAPAALRFWAAQNRTVGGDESLSTLAELWASNMEQWQREHGSKAADLSPAQGAAQVEVEAARDAEWVREPTEQADYWHWDGDEDHAPMIYHVLWSGSANKCFVSQGQYDIDEAIWCENFGGWWLKIEQPSVRAALAAKRGGATDADQA
jgi:hypothetical protein